jgi:DNA-binding IclR family transcriptional regulator
MSSHYLNSLELKTESAPYMRGLGENLGTIVFLARRQGDMMVYIDKEDKFTSLRKYSIIGQQKPLYCTSWEGSAARVRYESYGRSWAG